MVRPVVGQWESKMHGPNFAKLLAAAQQYEDGLTTALEFRNELVRELMNLPDADLLIVSTALVVELTATA